MQQSTLARARFSDQGELLAACHLEAQILENDELAVAGAIALGQTDDTNCRIIRSGHARTLNLNRTGAAECRIRRKFRRAAVRARDFRSAGRFLSLPGVPTAPSRRRPAWPRDPAPTRKARPW